MILITQKIDVVVIRRTTRHVARHVFLHTAMAFAAFEAVHVIFGQSVFCDSIYCHVREVCIALGSLAAVAIVYLDDADRGAARADEIAQIEKDIESHETH